MMLKYFAAASALLLLAAAPKGAYVPPAPPDAVTHHTARIGGASIPYTARAGTIALRNDKEQITARMFYVAYTKDGAAANRPITFFYNGGPGSSSIWLHMASLGPMRALTANAAVTAPAPFQLVNNDQSLLDKTDEVFVDAPNTGFSRVIGAGDPKDFMGVDQDGRAFTQFIQRYVSQFGRWNSPKVLFGESYGTTRDCVLVNMLQRSGMEMNGVVLQSSILNFNLFGLGPAQPIGGGDWAYVTYLPTEAATAWYHHKAGQGQPLQSFVRNAESFAAGRYLHDLAQGSDLSSAQYDSDVRTLHDFIGVSEQYIRESNLRVPYRRFQTELLRNSNTVVGRYDSRFTTYALDTVGDAPEWDPSDVAMSGAVVGTFNQYVRQTLRFSTNMQYRPTSYGPLLGAKWDWKHNGDDPPTNVTPDLAQAMTTNPHLQIFSANGYYDFATPYYATEYTLEHLGLAPELQRHVTYGFYESGHMIYLNPSSLKAYKSDLARWYDRLTSR